MAPLIFKSFCGVVFTNTNMYFGDFGEVSKCGGEEEKERGGGGTTTRGKGPGPDSNPGHRSEM